MGGETSKEQAETGQSSPFKLYLSNIQKQSQTELPPYRDHQLSFLRKVFEELDVKHTQSIGLENFDEFSYFCSHPLYERIRVLLKEELQKLKIKRINFNILLYLLSVFHVQTQIQTKYRYLFRLYDWDKDFRLNVDDLIQTFHILFPPQIYTTSTYKSMAEDLISKHGQQGFIKFEGFIGMIPEREVLELMSIRFSYQ